MMRAYLLVRRLFLRLFVVKDKLYSGINNILNWTQFPDAASYHMEFNLPNPIFSEQNVSTLQFTMQ